GNFDIIIHEMYVTHTEELGVLKEESIQVQVKGGPIYPMKPDYIPTPLSGATVSINNELDILYSGVTEPTGIVTTSENTSYTKKVNIEVTKETYRTYRGTIEPYMWSYSENATGPNNGNNIIRFSETGELCFTYYQYDPDPEPFIPPRIKRVIKAYSDNEGEWWYVENITYGQNPSIAISKTTTGEPIDGIFYDNGVGYLYENLGLPDPGTVINGSIFVDPGSMWNNNIPKIIGNDTIYYLHSSGIQYLGYIDYPHLIHAVFPYDDPENAEVEVLIGPEGQIATNDSSYLAIPAHNPSICLKYNDSTFTNEPIIAFEDVNSEICRKWYDSDDIKWKPPYRISFSENIKSVNPHIDAYGSKVSLVWQEETGIGADDYRIFLDNGRFVMDDTETDKRYPKIKRNSYISFVEDSTNVNMYYYKPDGVGRKINMATADEQVYYPDFEVKTRLIRPFLTEHTVYYMFTEMTGDIYKIKTGKEVFRTNDLLQPLFDLALVDTTENITNSPLEDYLPGQNRPIERLSSTVKGFDENRYYELIVTTTNNNKNTPYVLLIDGQEEAVIYDKESEITVPVSTANILDNELIVSLDRVKGNPNRTVEIKLYEYDEVELEGTGTIVNTMLKPFKPSKNITPFSVVNRGIQTGNYQLEVNLPNNAVVKIGIYDIMGREVNVMTKELIKGKNILNIKKTDKHNNELSKGVYFIRVETDNNSYTGKLINLK
ncbi:T9SS type A sorting domain-containing protein, partial [candidate division WOR-3 bacterium]|nr:T9SS type A sorting domain-containing protein [candidate division WOR-3 bacterium]